MRHFNPARFYSSYVVTDHLRRLFDDFERFAHDEASLPGHYRLLLTYHKMYAFFHAGKFLLEVHHCLALTVMSNLGMH